ncbi:hypothetical protein PT300_02440 [Enterobacteriaceae bacterium ESL0689]|nr:hypothetical protein [Enterobacteriaceae bacterium ESL0689]
MNDFEIEEKLRQHGFTLNELAILKEVSEKDKMTYMSMSIDLKKKFIKACLLLFFVYSWLLFELLLGNDPNDPPDRSSLIVVAVVAFVAIYFCSIENGI